MKKLIARVGLGVWLVLAFNTSASANEELNKLKDSIDRRYRGFVELCEDRMNTPQEAEFSANKALRKSHFSCQKEAEAFAHEVSFLFDVYDCNAPVPPEIAQHELCLTHSSPVSKMGHLHQLHKHVKFFMEGKGNGAEAISEDEVLRHKRMKVDPTYEHKCGDVTPKEKCEFRNFLSLVKTGIVEDLMIEPIDRSENKQARSLSEAPVKEYLDLKARSHIETCFPGHMTIPKRMRGLCASATDLMEKVGLNQGGTVGSTLKLGDRIFPDGKIKKIWSNPNGALFFRAKFGEEAECWVSSEKLSVENAVYEIAKAETAYKDNLFRFVGNPDHREGPPEKTGLLPDALQVETKMGLISLDAKRDPILQHCVGKPFFECLATHELVSKKQKQDVEDNFRMLGGLSEKFLAGLQNAKSPADATTLLAEHAMDPVMQEQVLEAMAKTNSRNELLEHLKNNSYTARRIMNAYGLNVFFDKPGSSSLATTFPTRPYQSFAKVPLLIKAVGDSLGNREKYRDIPSDQGRVISQNFNSSADVLGTINTRLGKLQAPQEKGSPGLAKKAVGMLRRKSKSTDEPLEVPSVDRLVAKDQQVFAEHRKYYLSEVVERDLDRRAEVRKRLQGVSQAGKGAGGVGDLLGTSARPRSNSADKDDGYREAVTQARDGAQKIQKKLDECASQKLSERERTKCHQELQELFAAEESVF